MDLIAICVCAVIVGVIGSMLGLGGGIVLIPVLTGLFGIPIKTAIGASLVSSIAVASAADAIYTGRSLRHPRLGIVLVIASTGGALVGGLTAAPLSPNILAGLFAVLLLYVIATPLYGGHRDSRITPGLLETGYEDPLTGQHVRYGIRHLSLGMGASFIAGTLSGLFGIGGSRILVPSMTRIMGIPLRAAIATSNLMLGITAATSATIYYQRGFLDPRITVPTALGVLIGAHIGARASRTIRSARLTQMFKLLLGIVAIQMMYQALPI